MKRVTLIIAIVLILAVVIFAGCAKQTTPSATTTAAPPPTTTTAALAPVKVIKGLTTASKADVKTATDINPFIDAVNKRLQGEVQIVWVGGNEIVPEANHAIAVKNGVVDMSLWHTRNSLTGIVPATWASDFTEQDAAGERKSGAFDVWAEAYLKFLNVQYLGLPDNGNGSQYYIFLNKEIKQLSDLQGMKLRVLGAHESVVKALGGSPMSVPLNDLYTAVQRGVVDGYITVPDAVVAFKLQEVTKYVVKPGYWQPGCAQFMNKDVWNSLSKHAQDVIMEEIVNEETAGKQNLIDLTAKASATLEAAGLKTIQLSPADSKTLLDTARSVGWEYALSKDTSGYVAKLRPLLSKP